MGVEAILVIAMFASFMVLLLLGFPVAWSLAGIGLVFAIVGHVMVEYFDSPLWFTWQGTMGVLDARIYGIVANELMVALPMFIFMGIMLDRSGIAEKLMHSLVRVLGPLRGGYAITVVIVGVLLAASTGIVGASVVLLGMLSLGPMMQANYNKSLAVGTACSVGTLGILVPPSIMLVLMADRLGTSDASVGKLFMGALIPGIMLGAMYILYILIASFLKKDLAPAPEGPGAAGCPGLAGCAESGAAADGPDHCRTGLDFLWHCHYHRSLGRGCRWRHVDGLCQQAPGHGHTERIPVPDQPHLGLHLRHLYRCHGVCLGAAWPGW